ncbi:NUDIX domain-containing protein [Streptomyces sp. NPDC058525]|uniref:NUDIX domain-containing protein n=1 Tax=Streptomyces sp. NPDC058525 TaxID=3346538 RepID=UPI00364E7A53
MTHHDHQGVAHDGAHPRHPAHHRRHHARHQPHPPRHPPYQVLVGGGVEPEDADLEAALLREVREEIAGEAVNLHPFCQLEKTRARLTTSTSPRSSYGLRRPRRTGVRARRPRRVPARGGPAHR